MESENINKVDKICSYKILPMTSDEKPIVIEFLKEFFFQREPLVVCLNFSDDIKSLEKLQDYAFKNLDNGLTYKAVSSNGDLMGVIGHEIMTRNSYKKESDDDDEDEDQNSRFNKFMNIFKKIKKESDIFGKYPEINRILSIQIVAVNDAFKGQGVCKVLIDKTKELALENECSMVHIECSSRFSAKAAEKLGYQCVYSLCYQEYKNEKGEIIFNTPTIHEQFKVYVLYIKKINNITEINRD